MPRPDIVIVGAGLTGLACALELEARKLHVLVLETGRAGREASWAAAGMLAVHDPENPVELRALSELSVALYPALLERLACGGAPARFETEWVLEGHGSEALVGKALDLDAPDKSFHYRREWSLDPRRLSASLAATVRASGVELLEGVACRGVAPEGAGVRVMTSVGPLHCGAVLDASGAWSDVGRVRPAKGQMLRVHAPEALLSTGRGRVVVRTPQIYMVPRRDGSVVIGATVEEAGFDKQVHAADMDHLRKRAGALVPSLAAAPEIESWAGLRPDTPDHLPLLGQVRARHFIAAGHFRNGVLLAPGTARVMTQYVLGEAPSVSLQAFSPARFA